MRKVLKKQIAIIALLMLLLPVLTTVTYAANEGTKFQAIEKSESFSQWEKLSEEQKQYAIQPSYSDVNLKDSVKRSTYNKALAETLTSDSRFNLEEELNNIYVKDQKQVGACWAFSYSNVIETTIANMYNRDVLEYSPMHIDYVTAKNYNRKVGDGGNVLMALAYGVSGLGPVYENDFTFESVYDETANSANKYFLSDINSVQLNQESRARIEDVTIFASIYKRYGTDSITYKDSSALIGAKTYTEEDVQAFRQLVKNHIQQYGAVTASLYSDMGITSSDEIVSDNGYYNNKTYAYYCDNYLKTANHAVTIVGWDDGFKKENFPAAHRPLNDGAYIVLNTWGEQFGNNGYFYVSYDDACIEQALCGIENITEKGTQDFYDFIYEYDQLGGNFAIETGEETIYSANVFERQTEENEYLTEVGLFLLSTQGVEVYVNPADDNLDACTLVGIATGTEALETGYHTLKLSSPVELTGEKFAVKIKYINTEGAIATLECNLLDSGLLQCEDEKIYNTATSNQGESFVSVDGVQWIDLYNLTIDNGNEELKTLKNTNACIKAFSTLSDGEQTVAVTGVTLDKETVTLKEGETTTLTATVLPENSTNKNLTWSSDNENVATVSNGVITGVGEGTTTITVTTEDGNFTDTCNVKVECPDYFDDIGNENNAPEDTEPDTETETKPNTTPVTGVTLDRESVTLRIAETVNLVATVLPENAANKNITWKSDNGTIALVINGTVAGMSEGITTITVTTEDGSFTDTCTVIVQGTEKEPDEEPETVVTGVTLDKKTLTLKEGETSSLTATILPENATNKNLTWSSDNENVATVSNGVITGIGEGTTTITVTTLDGNFTDTCTVTVEKVAQTPETIAVTGVTLDKERETLKIGETSTLIATVLPENATNKNITWKSDNESVAKIVNGVITGVAEGTATITVTTVDGNFTDTCTVTVEKEVLAVKVTGIELNETSVKMQIGEKTNLVATIRPTNATNKNVTWKSSNPDVATISETGIIEALKEGTTIITVTSNDGAYTASCEITVSKKIDSADDIYTESDKEAGKIEEAGSKQDTTKAPGKIPKAGVETIMILFIISSVITIIIYKKYKKYEDIH